MRTSAASAERMRGRVRTAILPAVLALATTGFGEPPNFLVIPDPGGAADAPIAIIGGSVAQDEVTDDPTLPLTLDELVNFVVVVPQTVTRVALVSVFVDGLGNPMAQLRRIATAPFRRGEVVRDDRRTRVQFSGTFDRAGGLWCYCRGRTADRLTRILVSVDAVTFADGSTWHAPTRLATAAPPTSTFSAIDGAQLEIVDASGSQSSRNIFDYIDEVVSFVNRAPVTADAVEFVYTLHDAGGQALAQRNILAKGKFSTGIAIVKNRRTIAAFPGVVVTPGGSAWYGFGGNATRIANVEVGVAAIHYTDNTSWRATP